MMDINIIKFKNKALQGKNVNLVPFSEKHFRNPSYLTWLHNYNIIKYLNLPSYVENQVTFEEIKSYAENLISNKNIFFYGVETKEGQFIGTFKIGPIDWYAKNVNLGIMIGDENYWGKGIGKELFSVAIEFCFNELKMHKVYGGCMEPNIGMRKIFEKLGFKEEGRHREKDFFEGKHWNHFHYGLLKSEYNKKN